MILNGETPLDKGRVNEITVIIQKAESMGDTKQQKLDKKDGIDKNCRIL